MTTTATVVAAVRDLAPALEFLTRHPDLPLPVGVTIYPPGVGNGGISIGLETAEQVQAWADATGTTVEVYEHEGSTHHAVFRSSPFPVNAVAVIRGGESS